MVPANYTSFNKTVNANQITQFAISANGERYSSGMVWTPCTVIHNQPMKRVQDVWVSNLNATSIELSWKLECSDTVRTITGYIISYCPIIAPANPVCRNNVTTNETIYGDSSTTSGRVTNLTPYTTYRLELIVKTENSYTLPSSYLLNTTFEAGMLLRCVFFVLF